MSLKQGKRLLVLVGVWAALTVWQWFTQTEHQRVPLTNVSGPKAPIKEAVPLEWAVKTPKPTPDSPAMPRRNLFAPLSERQEQMMLAAVKPRSLKKEHAGEKVMPAAPDAGTVRPERQELGEGPPMAMPPPPPPQLSPRELAEMAERQEREQRVGKLRAQATQYRLIGLSEARGVKQAFVGKGTDIYVVRQGDTLDGVFMVSIIDVGGVKIRDAEFNVEYTMPLKKDGS